MTARQDSPALQYIRDTREQLLEEIKDYVRIPSISTDDAYRDEVRRAAEWTASRLESLRCRNVKIFSTDRHPIVYGENLDAGKGAPTVLIYGHYDVQPADPLELWDSPAFEPEVRGEQLYGRGTSDMKGQVAASMHAVRALLETEGLPVNVKFLIEGEEEIGSPHLPDFIKHHKHLLSCDVVLNPDAGMIADDVPTVTYGLRGLAAFEITMQGPTHDLHSGMYGGTVPNPGQILCELVAGMHDRDGRVTLPGFYDHVRPLEDEERQKLSQLPMDEEFYRQQSGAKALSGETGYTPAERVGARPTLEVNGFLTGYTGKGFKAVLPASAMARVSARLVPDQSHEEVHKQLLKYLEENAPKTVTWDVKKVAGGPASLTDLNSDGVKHMSAALQQVWGRATLYRREGGSIPVVAYMQEMLGVQSVLTGFSLPEDNLHAPNEKVHLPTLHRGLEALVIFLSRYGKAGS